MCQALYTGDTVLNQKRHGGLSHGSCCPLGHIDENEMIMLTNITEGKL